MRKGIFVLFQVVVCALMFSCKPQIPSKYLQPDEMEDILYDYHLAMGMVGENDSNDFQKRMYQASVFKNHGITQAEFDSSLVYYTRHADKLQKIYENVTKRLTDEAVSLGASASDIGNFGENASSGDTANVWKEAASCVLTTQVPYNVESFYLKADTAYHKGDRLILSFDTQFIYQDGYKDGVAMLSVKFENDSVAARTIHLSESSHYSIAIEDDARLGIKEVRGFLSLQDSPNASATTLKLMFVSNIRLVRCHTKENAAVKSNDTDSSDSESGSDSVNMPETMPVQELKPMRKLQAP